MSVFKYVFKMHDPDFYEYSFSIAPVDNCSNLFEGEEEFDSARCHREDAGFVSFPTLRVLRYTPENERIQDIPGLSDDEISEDRVFSNMLNDSSFVLRNVRTSRDGWLYAEFYNRKAGSPQTLVQSYPFFGVLVVEARYNGFTAKQYKLKSSERAVNIKEIDQFYTRDILMEFPDEYSEGIVAIDEFRF